MEDQTNQAGAGSAPAARDPADLRGLSPAQAREYLFGHLTALKTTRQRAAAAREEAALWERRAELASQAGKPELQAAAEGEARASLSKAASLDAEAEDLAALIDRMRVQLPGLAARERSVDPDILLAQLQMATGEALDDGSQKAARETDKLLKEAQADQELASLKARMGSPDGAPKEGK